VKRQLEASRKLTSKSQVGISFRAAQAVVQVGRMQHEAEFCGTLREQAKQCDGVGSTRQTNSQPQSRL
jgi:hypothetical protein